MWSACLRGVSPVWGGLDGHGLLEVAESPLVASWSRLVDSGCRRWTDRSINAWMVTFSLASASSPLSHDRGQGQGWRDEPTGERICCRTPIKPS